jgi:hypothetical protein
LFLHVIDDCVVTFLNVFPFNGYQLLTNKSKSKENEIVLMHVKSGIKYVNDSILKSEKNIVLLTVILTLCHGIVLSTWSSCPSTSRLKKSTQFCPWASSIEYSGKHWTFANFPLSSSDCDTLLPMIFPVISVLSNETFL